MEPLYILPVAVLALGAAALVTVTSAAAREARELAQAITGLADLPPALTRVRSEIGATRVAAGVRRHR